MQSIAYHNWYSMGWGIHLFPVNWSCRYLRIYKRSYLLILSSVAACVTLLLLYESTFPLAPPSYFRYDSSYRFHNHQSHPSLCPSKSPSIWTKRAQEVREAYLHAYRGYMKYAAGHDELLPVSEKYADRQAYL